MGVMDLRDMLQEERQRRERDNISLTSRVDMAEERILVDSGKREERDRDIRTMMKRVEEDLGLVKRQLNAWAPPTASSLYGRVPGDRAPALVRSQAQSLGG